MEFTHHARKRCQQRGISGEALELILDYGRICHAPGGAIKLFLGKKEYRELMNGLKQAMKVIERAKNGTLILANEKILTVYKTKQT